MGANTEMLEKSLNKLLLKNSLPAIVGMLVSALYNLIDSIFVAQGAGPDALGGVQITLPIFMLIIALSYCSGQGGASLLANQLGANEVENSRKTIASTYLQVIISTIFLMILGIFFVEEVIMISGGKGAQVEHAISYSSVMLTYCFPFMFVLSISHLLRAAGKPLPAMYALVIGIVINIILDPLFINESYNLFGFTINGLGLGVAGAAYATIIGMSFSFLYLLIYFVTSNNTFIPKLKEYKPVKSIHTRILKIGFPSFLRNFALGFTTLLINTELNTYEEFYVVVYASVNRIVMVVFMISFGIAQGLQPILGHNYGAKKYDRTKQVSNLAMMYLTIYFVVTLLVLFIFKESFFALFLQSGATPEYTSRFFKESTYALFLILLATPVIGVQIVSSTVFQSFGKGRLSFVAAFSRQLFMIPLIYLLSALIGVRGVFLSVAIADLLASFLTGYLQRKEFKKY